MKKQLIKMFPSKFLFLYGVLSIVEVSLTAQDKPNIILITVDDLGWADLGCYGADFHKTPNIDKLSDQGLRFSNAYAAGPVSSPTRASILTGKSPARLKMTIWSEAAERAVTQKKLIPPICNSVLPLEENTLAEILKSAGYLTAHVGKWHLGGMGYLPENQGYDVSIGATHWGCPATFFYPYKGTIYESHRFIPDLELGPNDNYFEDRTGEYLTDRLTDEALKIIEDAGKRSFFLNLNYYTVHIPIEAKKSDIELFEKSKKEEYHHQNEIYAAMIYCLDQNIGRIMNKLKELNIYENTLLIFISDNGGVINEWESRIVTTNYPLRSGKGALYEGGIRVPLIMHGYSLGKNKLGKVIDVPVITSDLYPTILDIALNAENLNLVNMDGISFSTLLKDKKDEKLKRDLYWHYPHYYSGTTTPVSAIRSGNFKLIYYYEDGKTELYNLKNDISESIDISLLEPEICSDLLGKLKVWLKSVDAQFPVPNTALK